MTEKLIYNILLIALFFISIIVFIILFFLPAPYGRFTSKNWGIRINARLAWVVMESPAVIIIFTCFLIGKRTKNIVVIVFLLIWMIHYIQRTFVYPFLMRTRNKTFPISLILLSILFNCLSGYLNGRYLFNFSQPYPESWFKGAKFIAGVLIFIAGYVINIYSDSKLRQLRKPGEFSYKIPYGGFFRYISSPNYFGEILEWIGWAVATWSLPGLAFAVFTIANLVPRALSNHKWYLENFPDYPKDRKALIPFIY